MCPRLPHCSPCLLRCALLAALTLGTSDAARALDIPAYQATATDPATGEMLFRERWTVVRSAAALESLSIHYATAEGEPHGHKRLRFGRHARQPDVEARAFGGQCTARLRKAQPRWQADRRRGSRKDRHWPQIGAQVVVDTALLLLLLERRHDILRRDLRQVEFVSLAQSRPQRLRLHAHRQRRGTQELLRIDAMPGLNWLEPQPVLSLELDLKTGHALRYEGPPPLDCPGWPARIRVEYVP